jgi:hypothetical protein
LACRLAENEFGDFEFLVAIMIWYEILFVVNLVIKQLPSIDMLIDIEILFAFYYDVRKTQCVCGNFLGED